MNSMVLTGTKSAHDCRSYIDQEILGVEFTDNIKTIIKVPEVYIIAKDFELYKIQRQNLEAVWRIRIKHKYNLQKLP